MTKEELLKPRWKVIADYPGRDTAGIEVGDILTISNVDQPSTHYVADSHYYINLDLYPHLFRKLNWWQERKKEDLPEYVLWKPTNTIMKAWKYEKFFDSSVLRINFKPCTNPFSKYGQEWGWIVHTEPSTKEEYEKQESTNRI